MWGKWTSEKQLYYFKAVPPFTKLDDYSDDLPIEPPYRGAPKEQCSVYYFWWAYLRENEGYIQCCNEGGNDKFADLYADFGDVRDDNFFGWWRHTGRDLFKEKDVPPIRRLLSANEWNPSEETMIVAIPPTRDIDRLVGEFRKFVREQLSSNRIEIPDSTAKYPVHQRANLKSHYEQLRAYQIRKQYPDWTLEQIGYHLEAVLAEADLKLVSKPIQRSEDTDVQNAIRSDISRKLRSAKNLIKNVGLGRFPDTTP